MKKLWESNIYWVLHKLSTYLQKTNDQPVNGLCGLCSDIIIFLLGNETFIQATSIEIDLQKCCKHTSTFFPSPPFISNPVEDTGESKAFAGTIFELSIFPDT